LFSLSIALLASDESEDSCVVSIEVMTDLVWLHDRFERSHVDAEKVEGQEWNVVELRKLSTRSGGSKNSGTTCERPERYERNHDTATAEIHTSNSNRDYRIRNIVVLVMGFRFARPTLGILA